MNIFVNILVPIICLAIGYLMGSANISIPLGKLKFKQDPREYGSHNPGATNCGRLWGNKYFLIVFFFDVFKTISPLYIVYVALVLALSSQLRVALDEVTLDTVRLVTR